MIRKFSAILTIVFVSLLSENKAQSIYSYEGIGTINRPELSQSFAMGGLGIGTPSFLHINTINPAYLSYNVLSSFQVGVQAEQRNYKTSSGRNSQFNGGIQSFAYAFPIMSGKWSSSFSLLPYSTVKYKTYSEGAIKGTNATQSSIDRGEGGLNALAWSNGFSIKQKVQVGVRLDYIFGNIIKTSVKEIGNSGVRINASNYENKKNYRGLKFTFGVAYRHKLSEENFLNFGLVFSPMSKLNGKSYIFLSRGAVSQANNPKDAISSADIDFKNPQMIGGGVSFEKINVFSIGVDIESQSWKSLSSGQTKYNDLLNITLGGAWTPDFDNINSIWRRSKYLLGFNYQKTPYVVKNTSLTDFGINFGISLPVNAYSNLDLGFKVGQIGQSGNNLIRENYFKILLGATINDRWFIRRKYD